MEVTGWLSANLPRFLPKLRRGALEGTGVITSPLSLPPGGARGNILLSGQDQLLVLEGWGHRLRQLLASGMVRIAQPDPLVETMRLGRTSTMELFTNILRDLSKKKENT